MTAMHGYTGFPNDVKDVYNFLMEEYEFMVVSQSHLQVLLQSPRCVISISTEYDYAEFLFRSPEEKKWRFLGPYLEKFYPEETLPHPPSASGHTREQRVRLYLQYQSEIVKTYGKRFLTGDFSTNPHPSPY